MKLTIVIPAYNEEQAIASIIERTLAARERIVSDSPVQKVEIIVVSDGSTDATARIARQFENIEVIEFVRNRGYGAAIKRGFAVGTGDLVGFLDADGTCAPNFFAGLCRAIEDEAADVAIGTRMSKESRMPKIRRLGNRIYALILSALSNKVVTDTASGMRVIRRSALSQLYPLPDGLHFTPAMSARVLMDERLKIVERPMQYEERIGESKLHVVRDGVRFLRTILEMSLMWRPAKMFACCAIICIGAMGGLALHPLEMWLRAGRLQEDTIYRLLFCLFLGISGATLLSASVLSSLLHGLWANDQNSSGDPCAGRRAGTSATFVATCLDKVYSIRGAVTAGLVSLPILSWLIGPGIWTRLTQGVVELHWSRVVLAGLIAFGVVQMAVTVVLANLVRFHAARRLECDENYNCKEVGRGELTLMSRSNASHSHHVDEYALGV